MAVPISNVTRRQVYAPSGSGGAGPYSFTFEILANTDIAVYKDNTLLTLTTHYTVTINANGTGSVTITAAGLALSPTSPTQYAVVGNRTIARTSDFTTGGDFFANTLNDELDQQTIFAQQNAEGLQRALIAPQTDPTTINMTLPAKATRANKTLTFDADGNPTSGVSAADVANAVTYATNAANSATAAASSASAASSSASSASGSASTATTQATNASTSASNASTSASGASTSATNAAASASTASTQASNASTSATNAASSASAASTSASNASSSASAASTSASNAATAQTAAEAARDSALAAYDNFDDRYLGAKSSNPTLDNDGNALLAGALYFNTVVPEMRLWTGSAWVAAYVSGSGFIAATGGTMTGSLNFPDGSAASPSITNDGDTNTGILFPAADTVAIATAGAEVARFDSAGNLGLGVTPSGNYQIQTPLNYTGNGKGFNISSLAGGTSGNGVPYVGYNFRTTATADSYTYNLGDVASAIRFYDGIQFKIAASGTAGNAITFTTAMTLNASGSLLVGYTSSGGVRGVFSNGANGLPATSGTTQTYGALRVRGGDNAVIDFGCNSTDTWIQATDLGGLGNGYNLLINPNGGNLLVGTTGTNVTVSSGFRYLGGGRIAVTDAASTNATTTYEAYSTGAGAFRFYVGMGGTVYATIATISAISDQRLKENIRDLDDGLASVMALKPRKFDWKEGKGANIKNARGFIAQEFETVFPDMIDEWRDPAPEGEEAYKAINANLIPTLVKAIQEQQALITTLTARITALESA